jgi:hypothetical protein
MSKTVRSFPQEITMLAPKTFSFLLGSVASAALAVTLTANAGAAMIAPSPTSAANRGLTMPGPVAARCAVPFHGVLSATELDELVFPSLYVQMTGSGTASRVGRYTMTLETTVTLPQATSVGGMLRLTAANGDVITASVAGQAVVDGDIADIIEVATITGGTGRFSGATGTFTITRSLAQSTGISAGTFDGTMCLDK